MGKFRQCLTELSARDMIMAGYYSLTFLFISGSLFNGNYRKHNKPCCRLYLYSFDVFSPYVLGN